MTKSHPFKRILLYIAIILWSVLLWRLFYFPPRKAIPRKTSLQTLLAEGFRTTPNRLRIGENAPGDEVISISLQEPAEFDGLTRKELIRLRIDSIGESSILIEGDYGPMIKPFGSIIDKKPWWGLEGEFCYGYGGKESIRGASEESRFFLNPFLLLGLDEGKAFISGSKNCHPVYPRPTRLTWDPSRAKAQVDYDMQRFFKEKIRYPVWANGEENTFDLDNTNARDFGYTYMYVDKDRSFGVAPLNSPSIFDQPVNLRSLIHLGSSCGYPGGCNNGSPYDSRLMFSLLETPALLSCKLWQDKPASVEEPADFTFAINFQ